MQTFTRTAEIEMSNKTNFDRSQIRIREEKREDELQRQREEANANYQKMHRRLQTELIEQRDYKVFLQELRQVRLERLYDTMAQCQDGRQLRLCMREMIKHGAQRILRRLENTPLPLEAWMREALVNGCHLEMRGDAIEKKLLDARRRALKSLPGDVNTMFSQSCQDRVDGLRQRVQAWGDTSGFAEERGGRGILERRGARSKGNTTLGPSEILASEILSMETELSSIRRLQTDMRQNAAA